MSQRHYYLVTSLPVLAELGQPPPLRPVELLQRVEESAGPRELVTVLLLGDDLLQRQAFMTGEIEQISPAVLTPDQVRDEQPLPYYLANLPAAPGRVAADAVWASYFRYAAAAGARRRSALIREWVRYEVGLRNALATMRAAALGLEAEDYLVADELGDGDNAHSTLLAEWSAATDPLAGQRVLDRARWAWLSQRDGYFSFSDDEPVAYAAQLMLMDRWDRLNPRDRDDAK